MRPEFAGLAFRDVESAEKRLDVVIGNEDRAAAENLAAALSEIHDPDKALLRLEHLFEIVRSQGLQRDLLGGAPRYARMLASIFSQSQFLTDIAFKNPEYLLWLWEETDLDRPRSRTERIGELQAQLAAHNSFEARCRSMRRYRRREILRIGVRDLFSHAPIPSITEDLSNLADAVLEAALASAAPEVSRRYGEPIGQSSSPATFAVLALGKLGGRELNFSSDIDLLFLYSEDGETRGGAMGQTSNGEYYQKLGERLIKALAEQTEEGHIFRVDMRLRPHGKTAPLAISLETAADYYGSFGRAWERQALIKTRAAAGDLELGNRFIEQTRPFVYPRYFDDETLEEVLDIKRQVEAQAGKRGQFDTDVKLGLGGIRDIEFTVQMLQLLYGGRIASLRHANTLDAIAALGDAGLLQPLEATALAHNYQFLRQVEHRLQIEGAQQVHVLPESLEALDEFAGRLGYPSGSSFMADYRDKTLENRRILTRFIEKEGAGTLWVTDLLNPNSDGAAGLERLAQLGFRDPQRARAELLDLLLGPEERPHQSNARQTFRSIAPRLLQALAESTDPGENLVRLSQILAKVRTSATLYGVLNENPELSDYLVTLVGNSQYLTQILIRDPGLFDTFGIPGALDRAPTREELQDELDGLRTAYDSEAAVYRLHDAETVRIGMRDLIGRSTVQEVGAALTLLAEVCIGHVLEQARRKTADRFGTTGAPFAVLGLGKLGGHELGYGSDLDLVFVYDNEAKTETGISSNEYSAAVASKTIKALKEPTRYGALYDVDARLRPDGARGMLTIGVSRLRDYYAHEAQAWERLALIKARAVAGDLAFAQKVETEARNLALARPLTRDEIGQIIAMRQKLADQASPLDLKKHTGGIIEIEFALRMLQMQHAADNPALRVTDVTRAVDALSHAEVLSREQARTLLDSYLFFRRVENRIRIMHGRSGSELPENPEERIGLAQRLGIEGDLADIVEKHKRRVSLVYQEVVTRLQRQ